MKEGILVLVTSVVFLVSFLLFRKSIKRNMDRMEKEKKNLIDFIVFYFIWTSFMGIILMIAVGFFLILE